MRITENMVNEFNRLMNNDGSSIRLEFSQGFVTPHAEICLNNMKYIDSFILNTDKTFKKVLENFFKQHGILLDYNNTRSTFWSRDFS